jgi:hypothetical protein
MRLAVDIALSLLLILASIPISRAATLYVSTEGRAGWSGELARPNTQATDGPLPTLPAAPNRIRCSSIRTTSTSA